MKPRVAIEMQFEEGRGFFLFPEYRDLLEAAGASVVEVSPETDGVELGQLFASCDGFVIPGGDDIDAHLYGQEPIPQAMPPVRARDAFEPGALHLALQLDLPFLGICRGMQILNVVTGGTLAQRLATAEAHWLDGAPVGEHPICLDPSSVLASIADADTVLVNSLHRQGIDRLGEGIAVEAWAADGVVEALRLETARFALGVQWHPELQPESALSQRLAALFVKACAERRTRRQMG